MLTLVMGTPSREQPHDRTDPRRPSGGHRPTPVVATALGTPRRVFDPTFSGSGLTVPAWFFALSLLPSLLPRGAMVQGVASGVTVLIGYGIGAGTQAIWRYLGIPSVRGRARRVLVAIFVGLGPGRRSSPAGGRSAGRTRSAPSTAWSATASLESWVAVTNPPDWTPEQTAALSSVLEKRPTRTPEHRPCGTGGRPGPGRAGRLRAGTPT